MRSLIHQLSVVDSSIGLALERMFVLAAHSVWYSYLYLCDKIEGEE